MNLILYTEIIKAKCTVGAIFTRGLNKRRQPLIKFFSFLRMNALKEPTKGNVWIGLSIARVPEWLLVNQSWFQD